MRVSGGTATSPRGELFAEHRHQGDLPKLSYRKSCFRDMKRVVFLVWWKENEAVLSRRQGTPIANIYMYSYDHTGEQGQFPVDDDTMIVSSWPDPDRLCWAQ